MKVKIDAKDISIAFQEGNKIVALKKIGDPVGIEFKTKKDASDCFLKFFDKDSIWTDKEFPKP